MNEAQKGQPQNNEAQAYRLDARAVLEERIERARRIVAQLEALRDYLDWDKLEAGSREEEDLWSLFCRVWDR